MALQINKDQIELIPGYVVVNEIYKSQKQVLYKAYRKDDNLTVVIKTYHSGFLKNEDLLKIKREYDILNKIDNDYVIKCFDLVEYGNGNVAIVLEYFGESLSAYKKNIVDAPLSISTFLTLATDLVKALVTVHDAGIIHNNIETSNILFDVNVNAIKLIDFDNASLLSQEFLKSSSLLNWSEKSLPYLSPEQTGRINRGVDYRSDFYALGTVFYELLTNTLLFKANDDLEWVYHIISQTPKAPAEVNKNIPEVLSNIVLKLLAKNAEDRYQSSHGILSDLRKCATEMQLHGNDFFFEIGQNDQSNEFKIPQKLYGRQQEIETLETYFKNACLGSVEFCLVSGYSGVGKTAVVKELGRSIASKNGFLIEGKFDQFKQNAPYTTIISALSGLINFLLGEPLERLQLWKTKIQEALGDNSQLIVDYISELELIIGPQKKVVELPVEESQSRFLSTIIKFINVFGSENYPLVIFLDDLQWTDIPTLALIKELVLSEELNYVFLIGAYRNNEVDATHPLDLSLREIKKKRYVDNLILEPLDFSATKELVADTLSCPEHQVNEVTQRIYDKTHGNPFFSIELLKSLNEKGVLFFDFNKRYWVCNLKALDEENYSENVIDILVTRQQDLPKPTQEALQLAACIGATFDLETLSIIHENGLDETGAALQEALLQNMIIPLDNNYKFFGEQQYINKLRVKPSKSINPIYKFQHDRVQQAAYSQIQESQKEHIHLRIGRLLLNNAPEIDKNEQFLDTINHLNIGRRLILQEDKRIQLAQLNLQAGTKAKESSAYTSALDYLKIGSELIGEDSWINNYQLTWNLHDQLQHSYYLTGDWDNADQLTEILLEHSKTPIEKGLVLSARTRQYATTQRMKESIKTAYQGLSILGFELLENPTTKNINHEVSLIEKKLKSTEIAQLIHLPEIKEEKAKIASQLIMEIFPAAFLSGSGEMFPYLVLKSVNIGLEFGNSPETAFSYAAYGMLLCGHFKDTAQGYEFGKLGVALIEKLKNIPLKARIVYVYAMFVHHWSNHWSSMTPWFRKGIDAGYQSGDLLYLAYSAQDCIIWDPSLDLETASNEHKKLLEIVRECEYKDSLDSGTLFLQMQLNYMGLTKSRFSLTDTNFNEEDCLAGMQKRHFMTGICNHHLYKAEIHLLYNDVDGAMTHVSKLEQHQASFMALPQAARYQIVAFLVRSSSSHNASHKNKTVLLEKLHDLKTVMHKWVPQCPENFEHLYHFMEAELSAINNDVTRTLTHFEKAISLARANNFVRDEAMINEFMGKFFLRNKMAKAADGYLKEAQYLYYRWGAQRKVNEMAETYNLSTQLHSLEDIKANELTQKNKSKGTFLDFNSVLKASQAISGELILDKLIKSTLDIIMENAGAQRGYIVIERNNKIEVIRHKDRTENKNLRARNLKNKEDIPLLPFTLVNNALRAEKPVVIDNACEINPFSSDPYIKKNKLYSLACIPLPKHGKWPMAVYLENNITQGAFTDDRIKVINLLASQASISMENARIYEQQEQLLKAQQRFVPSEFLKHLGHDSITNVKLGESVSMEINVLFTDILNFTPLVENLSPQAVIQFLNRLFNEMGIVIKTMGGFIDSYQGDQIMALFPTSSFKAVKAAVEMTKALENFNKESEGNNIPPISIGIGINSGPLVLGTMGALNRMQCSVLGDTVNLASRIESLTRYYGAKLLIGEKTYSSIENKSYFTMRMVDYVAVKGKGTAVKLYEVVDADSEQRQAFKKKTLKLIEEAMELYYSRRFRASEEFFLQALKIDPDDNTITIFLERIKSYIQNPPNETWKGYESLSHK